MAGMRLIGCLGLIKRRPSWCNRAGRMDRCACESIAAVKLWRRVTAWDDAGEGAVTVTRDDLPGVRRVRGLRGHDRVKRCPVVRRGDYHRLHLPASWSQVVTCRKLVVSDRLTQHYVVCPLCNGRAKLLFMPRCTSEEYAHSKLAMDFLARRDVPAEDRAELIARYLWLLPPRRFFCRACLGIRYGDVKNPAQFGRGTLRHERALRHDDAGSDLSVRISRAFAREYEMLLPYWNMDHNQAMLDLAMAFIKRLDV